jgi:branched-chain amino acid transport system substrate-binding protein
MNLFSQRVLKWTFWALFGALLNALSFQALAQKSTETPIKLAVIEAFSGPFANTGDAVWRNISWAVERVNLRGGVKLSGAGRSLQLERYDSKGQVEEALAALRMAIDDGARVILQGNSSALERCGSKTQ